MKLIISDVFYFSNGRTVFCFLDERMPFVKRGKYHLLKNEEIVEDIWLDDEDLVKREKTSNFRSISTGQTKIYEKYNFQDGNWTLESVNE
jgi:hypothetical protein